MIYIVSGFFRSGTSMMMQALESTGFSIYRSRSRDAFNELHTDCTKRPNPVSLYEPGMDDLRMPGFPRQYDGKAVKILVPWLSSMAVHDYRVLVMRRNPEAIIASYERAFHEFWDKRTRDAFISDYPLRMEEALRWFRNRRDVRSVSVLEFEDAVRHPIQSIRTLGWEGDLCHAA